MLRAVFVCEEFSPHNGPNNHETKELKIYSLLKNKHSFSRNMTPYQQHCSSFVSPFISRKFQWNENVNRIQNETRSYDDVTPFLSFLLQWKYRKKKILSTSCCAIITKSVIHLFTFPSYFISCFSSQVDILLLLLISFLFHEKKKKSLYKGVLKSQ